MSRLFANEHTLLITQPPKTMSDVVNPNGDIDNAKLRSFIASKTGLKSEDRFLTDYTAAIDFEFQCVDHISPDELVEAIRTVLLKNASDEHFQHFTFTKNPDRNDPFQLDISLFQNFFNCVETASLSCLAGSCAAVGSSSVLGVTGVGAIIPVIGMISLFIFSPFFLLANRAGHLASITNRMNGCLALMVWVLTGGSTGAETYGIYHNLFIELSKHTKKNLNNDKMDLFVCHVICAYICAAVLAINVALVGKAVEKFQLDVKYPSKKFRELIARMKQVAAEKPSSTKQNASHQTLEQALEGTNFHAFLLEGKKKGAAYEKATQLIMEVQLLSLERRSNSAPTVTAGS